MTRRSLPVALTIAGSDSGGGAGVQADLKTFAALGVHGTSVITCITAQNPKKVLAIEPCSPETARKQLEAVFSELPPAAVKTGMLYSEPIIRVVIEFLKKRKPRLVVDPVMVSTSGKALLKSSARKLLQRELLPLASLVTPNLDETAALLGKRPRSVEEMRNAAKEIYRRFGCAVLVKGGHLRRAREAMDVFFDGGTALLLTAPFVRDLKLHGTGCAYSAAITARLAQGRPLPAAVKLAKDYIIRTITQSVIVCKHPVLNHFPRR